MILSSNIYTITDYALLIVAILLSINNHYMRLLLTLAIINLSACVVAHTHIGDWEYWDGTHFFRLALEQDGVCTLVAGGVAGESEEGIGGRCRYSEYNGSICIDEISDFIDNKPPEKVACEIKFNYENKTDTIMMQGQQVIYLVRTKFPR